MTPFSSKHFFGEALLFFTDNPFVVVYIFKHLRLQMSIIHQLFFVLK